MSLLLAEELVLLCMDDETGQCEVEPRQAGQGVALALVFELSLAGALTLKQGKLAHGDQGEAGDQLLDLTAESVIGLSPSAAVEKLAAEDLLQAILVRLVSRGVLHDAEVWSPGIHLPKDPHPEAAVREWLREVLAQGQGANEHEAALVALLHHLEIVAGVLPDDDAEITRARAAEVARRSRPMQDYQGEDGRPRLTPAGGSDNSGQRRTRSSWWDGLDVLELVGSGIRIFLR
ncbi:GOLPH3/VPS74 family protein [Ornithinimicrobium faecis]|uniref:GOLPH3/VPS74 family protein n=1 Tax=Ornithinimicrobium faecis TaxID=2934158 RepID=UPI0021188C7F|nr:GPP34 family phosphoprotein [Ornithinimicrobium sp. HY1745]